VLLKELSLNYGYARLHVDGRYDIVYSVPGYGVNLTSVRVDDPEYGLNAVASKLRSVADSFFKNASSYRDYASKIREGWCLAECASGAWLIYPPPDACDKARSACEAFQGGFKRFIYVDELEELARMSEEYGGKIMADADTLDRAEPPSPLPGSLMPWDVLMCTATLSRGRAECGILGYKSTNTPALTWLVDSAQFARHPLHEPITDFQPYERMYLSDEDMATLMDMSNRCLEKYAEYVPTPPTPAPTPPPPTGPTPPAPTLPPPTAPPQTPLTLVLTYIGATIPLVFVGSVMVAQIVAGVR
jgi:hypothetical protein